MFLEKSTQNDNNLKVSEHQNETMFIYLNYFIYFDMRT